ncbi:MAG: hypothetical protein V3U57_03680 [Robiginitomaculum sp.]
MKNPFFKVMILILFIAGCSSSVGKHNLDSILNTAPTKHLNYKSAQAAYEAGDFHAMINLMATEEDIYGLHKQLIPVVGRDKIEYSNGKWGQVNSCKNETTLNSNAIGKVLSEIKDTRLIIINEAHDTPQHREFILQLLPYLADRGFNVYAAETFSLGEKTLEEWKYEIEERGSIAATGFYTTEPTFSRLINKAVKEGFELVPYEFKGTKNSSLSVSDRIKRREEGQALNIWQRALNNPKNKIVMHVGYSHVKEDIDHRGRSWLATVLKNKYGINPLTISQTNCISSSLMDGWTYSTADDSDGVDLLVHSMPEILKNKRPEWLDLFGYQRISANALIEHNKFNSVIIEAVNTEDNIVADRIYFKYGETIDILLRSGNYKILASFDGGEKRTIQTLVIK